MDAFRIFQNNKISFQKSIYSDFKSPEKICEIQKSVKSAIQLNTCNAAF